MVQKFDHEFVTHIPKALKPGKIYISLDFGTVLHLCACGCGEEVNTRLSPNGWEMTYNGKVVSLYPSIGNWSFKCRSHYWIKKGQVVWAENWSDERVKRSREYEKLRKNGEQTNVTSNAPKKKKTFFDEIKGLFK